MNYALLGLGSLSEDLVRPSTSELPSTATGLAEIAEYADAVGFCKNVMIPRTSQAFLGQPTTAIPDA
ncbi:MAG TPA: hypothetical protein VFR88_14615, partial [Microlunatus sp.]|nr:hypothetical protein [Microlunatus sp.]